MPQPVPLVLQPRPTESAKKKFLVQLQDIYSNFKIYRKPTPQCRLLHCLLYWKTTAKQKIYQSENSQIVIIKRNFSHTLTLWQLFTKGERRCERACAAMSNDRLESVTITWACPDEKRIMHHRTWEGWQPTREEANGEDVLKDSKNSGLDLEQTVDCADGAVMQRSRTCHGSCHYAIKAIG